MRTWRPSAHASRGRRSEASQPRTRQLSRPLIAHVILVGLPGAGKSSVGQRVASRLARPFLDFDEEIERRTGTTIAEIFRSRGEPYFRGLELGLTQELAKSEGAILAPGGGWITVPGALALLRPPARMIYLRVAPEVAILRMGAGRQTRPLLEAAEPVEVLRRLAKQREPAYRQADFAIDTDLVDVESLALQIARFVDPSAGSRV